MALVGDSLNFEPKKTKHRPPIHLKADTENVALLKSNRN